MPLFANAKSECSLNIKELYNRMVVIKEYSQYSTTFLITLITHIVHICITLFSLKVHIAMSTSFFG